MIYEWHIDRPLPAGSVISVGDGRFYVATPGPRIVHSAVLPPDERLTVATTQVRELETELAEWHAWIAAAPDGGDGYVEYDERDDL